MTIVTAHDPEVGAARAWASAPTEQEARRECEAQLRQYLRPGQSGAFRGWAFEQFTFQTHDEIES